MTISIEYMLITLLKPSITLKQAEQLGRNIWAHGLRLQGHRIRVEREEAELSTRQKDTFAKISKKRSNRVARIKDRIRARKLKQDREAV